MGIDICQITVECLGSCGTAPMMQVDETYHENLTEEKIDRILEELGLRIAVIKQKGSFNKIFCPYIE
jgi:(2Fe-2S) ferredoxin